MLCADFGHCIAGASCDELCDNELSRVLVYDGISTEAEAFVLGRVIADRGLDPAKADESTLRKMTRLGRMLHSTPLADVFIYVTTAFISGSPWQLQPRLRRFLRHAGLPRVPLFLKRINLGSDVDAFFDQSAYKQRQLEQLLQLLPSYRVICFNDSSEHDPEVYRALQRRHPEQIQAISIHDVGGLKPRDPQLKDQFQFRN